MVKKKIKKKNIIKTRKKNETLKKRLSAVKVSFTIA